MRLRFIWKRWSRDTTKQRKSSSEQIIDVQASTCGVERKLAAATAAFFHTHSCSCHLFFLWGLIHPLSVKNCYTNSGLENGRHKTTRSKSFCLYNYLYICWSCLGSSFAYHGWIGVWPLACVCAGQHGWWLIPRQRTEWQVEHGQSAACLISCSMQMLLTERNSHGLMQHFLLVQNDGNHTIP